MKRILLLVVAVALVGAAVAGADSTDPRVKLTKADQARAKASLLVFSDMGPAWTGTAENPTSLKIPVCPGDQRNNSDLTLTGHAESYVELKSEGLAIDTDVEVFGKAGQANTLYGRMVTTLLTGCLKYDLVKSLGASATIVAIDTLKLQKVGAHSAGYRVSLKYQGNTVLSDYIFIAQGRTQFFVNVVAPVSLQSQLLALENRVAVLLASRAAKA